MNHYDTIHYESNPYPETHPNNLAVLGRLFGLHGKDPASCRVLELGCASGGNLIPLAFYQPNASFVGIELSEKQLEPGQLLINRLGLKNIELRQGDILDLDNSLGQFDYIIAHGVYSWVPKPVREKILTLCRELLTPQGLAYISYNTLPGWRMRGMLRDMLLYTAGDSNTAQKKLDTAGQTLSRLQQALIGLDSLNAQYLRSELDRLSNAHPSYLLYEFMANSNQAFLFSKFIADAKSHGLGYVCDTELHTMFPSTLGDNVATALADIEDDIELEQWLDFVRARQFRQSLLCAEENRIDDEIDLDVFERFSLSADLKPFKRPELRREKASSFTQLDGTKIKVTHPLTKAALLYLGEVFPNAVPMQRLQLIAQDRVRNAGGHDFVAATESLTAELFSLFAHHALHLHWHPYNFQRHITDRPVVNKLGRAQAENGWSQIASVHHAGLEVDSFSARCISLMDGRLNQEQLVAKMNSEIRTGSLQHPTLDLGNWPKAKLHKQVQESCRNLVKLMSRHGLLEAQ